MHFRHTEVVFELPLALIDFLTKFPRLRVICAEFGRKEIWGLFLKSPETFRVSFGYHYSLYIFATPRF